MLVSTKLIKKSTERYKIGKDIAAKEQKINLSEEELVRHVDKTIPDSVVKGNLLGAEDNLVKRLELIEAHAPEPATFAFERAIGKNDSVYSNFVELIAATKQKVGRVVVKTGNKTQGYATGFMVSERLLLTNWHVFNNETDVADSEVQFFYEYDIFGRPLQPVSFRLKPLDFFYSYQPLDYCFVQWNRWMFQVV